MTVTIIDPKGNLVADGEMGDEIVQLAAPDATPQAQMIDSVGPVQTWSNNGIILPDIGDVDAKLLALGGLSNTIVVSTTTAELLATITVNIGANGNWFVGDVDTGVPASGTDPEKIMRMVGSYEQAPMSFDLPTLMYSITAGGQYVVYDGLTSGYVQFTVTALIQATIAVDTSIITIDSMGTLHQHVSPDLLLVPDSQAILATFSGSGPTRAMLVFPTVRDMLYGLQDVESKIIGFVAEAEAWAIQSAASASESAVSAAASLASQQAAAASEVQTGQDAVATAADRVQTGLDATATASDRVQTGLDATATAADAVQTGQDKVATTASAAEALASEGLAREYAVNPEGTPVSGTSDESALSWAAKAKRSAESIATGVQFKGQWDASGGIFPTPTLAPTELVDYYRISVGGTMTGTGAQQPVTTTEGDTLWWDMVADVWYELEAGDGMRTVNSVLPDASGNVNVTTASIGAVDLLTDQVIAGKKTFSGIIELPSSNVITGGIRQIRYNAVEDAYEGYTVEEGWAPLGGGAGVPKPVIKTADFTAELEKGNWCDLTSVSSMVCTIPAMDLGDFFAVGDAYGLCSVAKPITIPACIWNGAALEDLVLTQKNINLTLQKIDNLGGLKIVDGIGEGGTVSDPYPTAWASAESWLINSAIVGSPNEIMWRLADENTMQIRGIIRHPTDFISATPYINTTYSNLLGSIQYTPASVGASASTGHSPYVSFEGSDIKLHHSVTTGTATYAMLDATFIIG